MTKFTPDTPLFRAMLQYFLDNCFDSRKILEELQAKGYDANRLQYVSALGYYLKNWQNIDPDKVVYTPEDKVPAKERIIEDFKTPPVQQGLPDAKFQDLLFPEEEIPVTRFGVHKY